MRRTISRSILATAAACGLAAAAASAQTWHPLTPDGGETWSLHALPGGSGRVFATAGNGLFLSTDAGRTWRLHARYVSGPFATFVPSPATSYTFDWWGALLHSDDYGDTWTPTGHVNTDMSIVAAAAILGGVIYSGPGAAPRRSIDQGLTFTTVAGVPEGVWFDRIEPSPYFPEILAAGSNGTVYRSIDNGASWSTRATIATLGHANSLFYMTSLDVVASIDGHVLYSADGGATWSERLYLPGARAVRVSPNATTVVVTNGTDCRYSSDGFATANAIGDCGANLPTSAAATPERFASLVSVIDGSNAYRVLVNDPITGASATPALAGPWNWAPSNAGLQAREMRGLALTPQGQVWSGVLIQSTSLTPYFGPLLRSIDGGATWTNGLGGKATAIRSIVIDPTTAADPATMRVYAAGRSVRQPAGVSDSGIWRSDDNGQSWTALNAGVPESNIAGWTGQFNNPRKVVLDPRSCATPPASGPCTEGPLQMLIVISDGAGSPTQRPRWRVAKSVQTGDAHWTATTTGLPDDVQDTQGYESAVPVDIDVDPVAGTLYLGMFADAGDLVGEPRVPSIESGVFRSTNGGASWTHASSGLPLYAGSATTTKDVYAIALHPRRAGVLWASTIQTGETASQIHRSVDGGDHWTSAGAALTGCDVRDLQVDSAAPDVLYAAGVATAGTGCLWRSEDAGATWTPLHGTLPAYAIYDVRQDPRDRRRLVVASGQGVWDVVAPSDRIFTDTGN